MKKKYIILLIFFLGILFTRCIVETEKPAPNNPPTTTIANVPVPMDTLFPLVKITWDGGDNDGYIKGCEYKYTTYHLDKEDSFKTDWIYSDKEELELVFESSDNLNKQIFQIRSVDNEGNVDPTPAKLTFYTPRTELPKAWIISPGKNDELFFLDKITDWWQGIELSFSASDADGEIVEYGWSVDNSEWTWTKDTTLFLTPDVFAKPYTGEHVIKVTAKDNTNLIDPTGSEITINLVEPKFSKKILIIDETDEEQFPTSAKTTDEKVDSFYTELFNPDDTWDYVKVDSLPSKEFLGDFKLIVWHADNNLTSRPHEIVNNTEIIKDYLNVGGDIIVSGWRILKSFAWRDNFPKKFEEGSFVRDYLHIIEANESPVIPANFEGANGIKEIPDVLVDENKLKIFPYYGKMNVINVVNQVGGFTRTIFSYRGSDRNFAGKACGLHYIGTSYNAIVLGFPLYFTKAEGAKNFSTEILKKLGY